MVKEHTNIGFYDYHDGSITGNRITDAGRTDPVLDVWRPVNNACK